MYGAHKLSSSVADRQTERQTDQRLIFISPRLVGLSDISVHQKSGQSFLRRYKYADVTVQKQSKHIKTTPLLFLNHFFPETNIKLYINLLPHSMYHHGIRTNPQRS